MGTYKQRRSRKPISIQDAQLRLTDCIKELERVILDDSYDAKNMQAKIQASYAMSNVVNRYATIVEKTEIIERIEALEENQLRKVSWR